ncbi:MAG: recombinase zinc beta ribbon domain-containing protein [Christensenellaceae bacterium]|nr:recombinase zinc beta ribbon domain-containing protein [Christensenellaceae bacterium]
MFSGLVCCADCGQRMMYGATNNYRRDCAFFDCSTHRKSRGSSCKDISFEKRFLNSLS